MKKIALIGNPNCGKTTLFNLLTGARQKVGNWPGVTVEKKFGYCIMGNQQAELIDLPGIYSLEQEYQGVDEKISCDFLTNNETQLIINLIDASNLERGLVLTQQLIELGVPIIVVLNMLDVAEQHGISVDSQKLSEQLGLQVVSMVAARKEGIQELKVAMLAAGDSSQVAYPSGESESNGASAGDVDPLLRRYHRSKQLLNGVVEVNLEKHSLSEKLDRVVLNRWLGVPIFLLMIYLMFTFAVNLGSVFIDFFDILFAALLVDGTTWILEQLSTPALLVTLLAEGVGGGITLVATFIPVIGFLYLCLSVLEDSGYMSRAAFVIDRLMGSIGLPGNAFVPLIVGFGCNVPAVMATRTLGRDSDRLMTIAMAPFMSCGARLTVYACLRPPFSNRAARILSLVSTCLASPSQYLPAGFFGSRCFPPKLLLPSRKCLPITPRLLVTYS